MASINQVTLVGRVGQDPVARTLNDGQPVVNFSLATSEKYNGEEHTEWHKIVVYRQGADFARQYIKKGDRVHVGGQLRYRKWTDKDGVEHEVAEIIARQVQSFESKRDDAPKAEPRTQQRRPRTQVNDLPPANDNEDTGLPF